jgi:hypothetical protein
MVAWIEVSVTPEQRRQLLVESIPEGVHTAMQAYLDAVVRTCDASLDGNNYELALEMERKHATVFADETASWLGDVDIAGWDSGTRLVASEDADALRDRKATG